MKLLECQYNIFFSDAVRAPLPKTMGCLDCKRQQPKPFLDASDCIIIPSF